MAIVQTGKQEHTFPFHFRFGFSVHILEKSILMAGKSVPFNQCNIRVQFNRFLMIYNGSFGNPSDISNVFLIPILKLQKNEVCSGAERRNNHQLQGGKLEEKKCVRTEIIGFHQFWEIQRDTMEGCPIQLSPMDFEGCSRP